MLYSNHGKAAVRLKLKNIIYERLGQKYMTLCGEFYFEINVVGAKCEVKKLVTFLRSGGLDDFFEFSTDFISYDDDWADAADSAEVSVTLTNEDYGIEIEEIDTDELLEVFCRASKNLYVTGSLYDMDDDTYSFKSDVGDSYYVNAKRATKFNEDEDLDEEDDD